MVSSSTTSTRSTSPDPAQYDHLDWSLYGTVINAGAYTAVDKAETAEGRALAWKANAQGPALLARVCAEHNITPGARVERLRV